MSSLVSIGMRRFFTQTIAGNISSHTRSSADDYLITVSKTVNKIGYNIPTQINIFTGRNVFEPNHGYNMIDY